MTDSDDSLVQRSRQGDRAAFEELVRRTSRMLFAQIYLQTADTHKSEDLVQETYLRAWKSIGRLTDAKTFRGWLSSIAQNAVIDAARRKRPSEPIKMDFVADQSSDSVEEAEQRQKVLSVLRSLPQEYRDVLTLRYLAGADYETIARQLAISNGSLRGLLHRGLKMLREKCKP